MLVYIASPLFSQAEKEFNQKIRKSLEIYVNVYLPQEDGGLVRDYIKDGKSKEEALKFVAEKDLKAVYSCDLLLVILDGRTIDEGAAFELGVAYAEDKTCIGLQTDQRREAFEMNNPMIEYACEEIFYDVESVIDFIKRESEEVTSTPKKPFTKKNF